MSTPQPSATLSRVRDRLEQLVPGAVLNAWTALDNDVMLVKASEIRALCRHLKYEADLNYRMVSDLSCVDRIALPEFKAAAAAGQSGDDEANGRFEMIYQLYSLNHKHRLRLKARLSASAPVIDSVTAVWKAADWLEREVWDMYGVRFIGHPNLKRLLMYESFVGHPLRKDYPLKGHQPIVPLRFPIPVTEDPAHQIPAWVRDHSTPLGIHELDNTTRLPISILAPDERPPPNEIDKDIREQEARGFKVAEAEVEPAPERKSPSQVH